MSGRCKEPLTVYQRIKRGSNNGRRVVLSPDDCFTLYAQDSAIQTRADQDDEEHAAAIASYFDSASADS